MSTQEAAKLSRDSLPILAAYESPVGELETSIVELFVEAFSIDRVGADDDFFDLGGDSVAGVSLAIQISQYIGREFRSSLLVRYGTPRKIAALLLRARTTSLGGSARPPIFIVHGMLGIMMPRPEFIAGLTPDQEIRVFELPGIRGERPPHTRIEGVAADYVGQLQKEYPVGPPRHPLGELLPARRSRSPNRNLRRALKSSNCGACSITKPPPKMTTQMKPSPH
jgi:acyl carrier protein